MAKGEGLDSTAPEYTALADAQSKSTFGWSRTIGSMLDLDLKKYNMERWETEHNPNDTVPEFKQPVQVYKDRFYRRAPADPVNEPVLDNVLLAFEDALTGHTRASPDVIEEQRCAIAVVDVGGVPVPEGFCETAMPLPVNYDLTAETCGDGIAPEACRESCIFPHLNVVFQKDRLTVFAPRPVLGAALVSVLYASWGGVERALTPSATFMWDGSSEALDDLQPSHDIAPKATNLQVWRDMLNATVKLSKGLEYEVSPHILKRLYLQSQSKTAALFMKLGEPGEDETIRVHPRSRGLRNSSRLYQDLLIPLAQEIERSAIAYGIAPGPLSFMSPCGYLRVNKATFYNTVATETMRDVLAVDNGQACDAVIGYSVIF